MTYDAALQFFQSTYRFGSKPGLERITELLGLLGNPQDALRFIHIAGTNGKGSTSVLCESILREAGYKTGLFISPYVENLRERIQVNREMIDETAFARHMAEVCRALEQMSEPITEFEVLTALALLHFKEEQCDPIVFEVGLGGRFDATNAISKKEVAIITKIALDHTEYLGTTLAQIAAEKAGILKEDTILITCFGQEDEVLQVFKNTAKNLIISSPPENSNIHADGADFTYQGSPFSIQLRGNHQLQNAGMALEAMYFLRKKGYNISDNAISSGLKNAWFHGRLEKIGENPIILIDGAHNENGVHALTEYMDAFLQGKKLTVICGMLSDKDFHYCIKELASRADSYFAIQPDNPRALTAKENAKVAQQYCSDIRAHESIKDAVEKALDECTENSCIIIGGSLYFIGDAKRFVQEYKTK